MRRGVSKLLAASLLLLVPSVVHGQVSGTVLSTGTCRIFQGASSPESVVTGRVCDQYRQTNAGGALTVLWMKASGTDTTTGWVAVGAVGFGGTGLTSVTANRVLYATSSNVWGTSGDFTFNGTTLDVNGIVDASTNVNTPEITTPASTSLNLNPTNSQVIVDHTITTPGSTNLTIAPTGDVIVNAVGNDVLPENNYEENLGSLSKKYLTLHAAELWVETLVAQNTIATIGGRILVGPTTVLTSDLGNSGAAFTNLPTVSSAFISQSGLAVVGGFPACAVDGAGTNCWNTNTAVANSYLRVDYGAGNTQAITKAGIFTNGVNASIWKLQYSDDAAAWTDVCTLPAATVSGWDSCYVTTAMSVHRYWQFLLTNTPGGGGATQGEIFLQSLDTVAVKHNEMAAGDVVYLEADGKVEFMHVTAGPTGAGPYSYSMTRDLDNTGRNQWYAGDAMFNTGATGDGFIDLYSLRGVKASSEVGPTIVGNVRTSATYNAWAPRWAIGNLNGLYGYASTIYGTAFGDPTTANITLDATNGLRGRHNTTTKFQIDTSGNVTLLGANVSINTGGIEIAPDTSTTWLPARSYKFTVPTGNLGIFGSDSAGNGRLMTIESKWTGTGDRAEAITLNAENAPGSGGTANSASVSVSADGSGSTAGVTAKTVSIGPGLLSVKFDTNGNMKTGGLTTARATTEATQALYLFDGTAPVGTLSNGVTLYSASGELRSMDSAGNSTLLSPHDDLTNEIIIHSRSGLTGMTLRIEVERMLRDLDTRLGGGYIREYVEIDPARMWEPFKGAPR